MRRLIWGGSFVRAYRRTVRKKQGLREAIEATLRLLAEEPFTPRLATHKLKGKLSDSWACTVTYDLRIIFDFVKDGEEGTEAIFLLEIGTHDEVY